MTKENKIHTYRLRRGDIWGEPISYTKFRNTDLIDYDEYETIKTYIVTTRTTPVKKKCEGCGRLFVANYIQRSRQRFCGSSRRHFGCAFLHALTVKKNWVKEHRRYKTFRHK